MNRRLATIGAVVAILLVAAVSCSSSSTEPQYNPTIPNDLSSTVDNPFFPLVPGTVWQYESVSQETNRVEVMAVTRVVNGVESREVHDQVFVNGELTEDTYDWYAQDGTGAVWYLGEDSKELEHGTVISTEGSWEWGKDGALPGIIMSADPASQVGIAYRQEYLKGVAEDWGRVTKLDQSVTVPFGSFTGCIVTDDWNALESGLEHKMYCPNIGVVLETSTHERSELVDLTP
jgi:hypothetical protein